MPLEKSEKSRFTGGGARWSCNTRKHHSSGDAFTDESETEKFGRPWHINKTHSAGMSNANKLTTMERPTFYENQRERGARRERERKKGPLGVGAPVTESDTFMTHTHRDTHESAAADYGCWRDESSEESRVQISGSRSTSTKIQLYCKWTHIGDTHLARMVLPPPAVRTSWTADGAAGRGARDASPIGRWPPGAGGQTDETAERTRSARSTLRAKNLDLILFSGESSSHTAHCCCCAALCLPALASLSLSPSSISAVFLCCQIYLSKCAAATFMLTAGDLNWMLGARASETDRRSRNSRIAGIYCERERGAVCVCVYYSILRARAAGILGCLSGNAPRFFCASGSSGAAWEMLSLWSWRIFTPGAWCRACYLFDINFINICRMQNNTLGGRAQIHNNSHEIVDKYVFFIFISMATRGFHYLLFNLNPRRFQSIS